MAQTFQKWGREGGLKRAKNLSQSKRQEIARKGALTRWQKSRKNKSGFVSVRLNVGKWNDPVFLEEVLIFGDLIAWRELRERIYNWPFGEDVKVLEKVLGSHKVYGVTAIWVALLKKYRGE